MRPAAASRARAASLAVTAISHRISAAQPSVMTRSKGSDSAAVAPNTVTASKPAPICHAASAASGGIVTVKLTIAHLRRSEEHTSELQSLMRISYAVFCLKQTKSQNVYIQHRI